MKKEFWKTTKRAIITWTIELIIVCTWFYIFTKARLPTNPNLSDTTPSSLYVTNNETLSAAKRNTLVDKTKTNYISQYFTDWDVALSTTRQDIKSISLTIWESPVSLSANWTIRWWTVALQSCRYTVDGVDYANKWWFYFERGAANSQTQMSINYITDVLSPWTHTFTLKCRCWATSTLRKSTTTYPLYMSATELK